MSCHIVMNAGMSAFCGRDKFGVDSEDKSYHSYVEAVSGKRMYMADCKMCRLEYHQQELDDLELDDDDD